MTYILDTIKQNVAKQAKEALQIDALPVVEPANPKFGADLAIPCFVFARDLKKAPPQIAAELAEKLQHEAIAKTEAVSGFVNIWLNDAALAEATAQIREMGEKYGEHQSLAGKKLVIETNNPNPFKDMHIGHAYNSIVADTVANLLEAGGGDVHRVSYHGDVGTHVGKSMWAILNYIDGDITKLDEIEPADRAAFMSRMYVEGAAHYEKGPLEKQEVDELAKQSFTLDDSLYKEVYEKCKTWSFEYLDYIIASIGSKPGERRFLESETDVKGREVVEAHIGDVFERSEGAIIFPGEKYDLHTVVFISSRNTTVYGARDLGLMRLKEEVYHPDMSYIVTGEEQRDYFNVVFKAAELALPELAGKTTNIPTGLVKLSTGKMSSRTGKVVNIDWIFDAVRNAVQERGAIEETIPDTLIGALRYTMLKVKIGGDVIFDINESVSIEGNSGPYLQYAYARGKSILRKLEDAERAEITDLIPDERELVVKMLGYSAATKKAIDELAPHHVTAYLYELTQQFNRFYEKNRIVGDERQAMRATLVGMYTTVLKNGLTLLGIPAPEQL